MRAKIFCATFVAVVIGTAGVGPAQAAPPSGDRLAWAAGPASAVSRAQAQVAPPWGACGRNTDPQKLVRLFTKNRVVDFALRCGGPKYSSSPTWGYRHILWRHRGDFERMAAGTYQNWRDIADLAMSHNTSDPDRYSHGGGKSCYSRVLYLRNIRTNQVVRKQIFKMIVSSSNNIITSYPAGTHC
ncbi:hypothetical protein [Actinomadura sp. WMMB 499]|uniref:hypothetical protein n=1 Tax=Actinomadura sp. WMMB 499 TaxID=1219491 RepID=UPI001248A2E0|nr:hypothetical protein [Actinomadura sp. WMMB 499]QFG20783.1 hypothetical protein F7P10_06115 [Actinomadura sp. WMMB 499]